MPFIFLFKKTKTKLKRQQVLTFVKIYLHSSKNEKLESTHKNAMISEVIQKCECFRYNEYIKTYQVVFSSPASICPYIQVANHWAQRQVQWLIIYNPQCKQHVYKGRADSRSVRLLISFLGCQFLSYFILSKLTFLVWRQSPLQQNQNSGTLQAITNTMALGVHARRQDWIYRT